MTINPHHYIYIHIYDIFLHINHKLTTSILSYFGVSLCAVVDEVINSPNEMALCLYNSAGKKRRKLTNAGPVVGGPKLKEYANFGTLLKGERAFSISLLVALSDLTPQDCLEMLEVPDGGTESNAKIICAGTQVDIKHQTQ